MAQNNLNSFLALAEDLEIKGLTQNNGRPANTQTVKPSEVRGRRAVSASRQCSPLSLVEECRGLALIGREMLLRQLSYAIKNQLVASKALALLLAGSLWHKE